MRIALVVMPNSDENLQRAAQVGVTDVVGRYTGVKYDQLARLRDRVDKQGLRLSVIEGYLPIDRSVAGKPDRDRQIDQFITFMEHMHKVGAEICCYNWMPDSDWTRTNAAVRERGGALVTGFDAALVADAPPERGEPIDDESLWANLEYFLKRVIPAAEANGIKLAMHPDDPPMSPLRGQDRILSSIEDFKRLVQLVPSDANGICFCQGCFSEMGYDIPAAIEQLGSHITYAHFRNVRGCVPAFVETFHDTGQINMFDAIKAYKKVGFTGPMRPDHVPILAGEKTAGSLILDVPSAEDIVADTFNSPVEDATVGYTMLGRLHAVGYMRGLMDAAGVTAAPPSRA